MVKIKQKKNPAGAGPVSWYARLRGGAACRDLGRDRTLIATVGLGRRDQRFAFRPLRRTL